MSRAQAVVNGEEQWVMIFEWLETMQATGVLTVYQQLTGSPLQSRFMTWLGYLIWEIRVDMGSSV